MKLNVALKEWCVICELLGEGELALLLRKGGILEPGGPGAFDVEYPRFGLYPTWAHQKLEMIKPAWHERVHIQPEPGEIPIRHWAEVVHVWEVDDRERFEKLDGEHCWSEKQIDMRFDYRANNPLFLMAVRVYTLPETVVIPGRDEYGGCKSWVELHEDDIAKFEGMDLENVETALPEEELAALVERVTRTLEG